MSQSRSSTPRTTTAAALYGNKSTLVPPSTAPNQNTTITGSQNSINLRESLSPGFRASRKQLYKNQLAMNDMELNKEVVEDLAKIEKAEDFYANRSSRSRSRDPSDNKSWSALQTPGYLESRVGKTPVTANQTNLTAG